MKKRIAVITLVGDNYGNKFQNYAVEQILGKYGDVITYPLEELYPVENGPSGGLQAKINCAYVKEVLISRIMYRYDVHSVYRGVLSNLLYCAANGKKIQQMQKKRHDIFQRFTNDNLHISGIKLNRDNTSTEWENSFDFFVCGSDQIWNPTYRVTSELAFCSFGPQKTMCLAPSFGVSEIPRNRAAEYAEWIRPICALSVREDAGARIIKDLTGRDAEVLLDPTMLAQSDIWHKLCKQPNETLPGKYIVCYFLGKIDKKDKKIIDQIAKEKKLPVVFLFDTAHPQYYTLDPAEVLFAIKNAKCVLTDSFHGTVFSILFRRDFLVFKRNEGGLSMNSRLDTLLKKFGFEDRTSTAGTIEPIDDAQWREVDAILSIEREKANRYIQGSLTKIEDEAKR